MATTLSPLELADRFDGGGRVLIRDRGRVLSAWSYEPDSDAVMNGAMVHGQVVFGGPPAPDVGDDIATWFLHGEVEIIDRFELADMIRAKEADEAARPVLSLGAQGELVEAPVVAPDGSTVLAAEDMPDGPVFVSRAVLDHIHSTPVVPDQLAMRRRTLARFCRDYAQAWEDGEDTDLLGMLESNLQVTVRRVLELVEP